MFISTYLVNSEIPCSWNKDILFVIIRESIQKCIYFHCLYSQCTKEKTSLNAGYRVFTSVASELGPLQTT